MRRKFRQLGHLLIENGKWKVRFRKWVVADGRAKRIQAKETIGEATGPRAITRQDAVILAWHLYLKYQNHDAEVVCTVGEFYVKVFCPEHCRNLKPGSRADYQTRWRIWVEPVLGQILLTQVKREDVQRIIGSVLAAGRSVQTAAHVRKLIQALFTAAKKKGWYVNENPAAAIDLPEMERRPAMAYTHEQARRILEALASPVREAVLLSLTTGLGPAEFRGLRLDCLNLTPEPQITGGEALPPFSLAVRRNFYLGEYGSPKTKQRRRIVPLLPAVADALRGLLRRERFAASDDPVFCGATGRPIDTHNVSNRVFGPLAKALGFPVTWYALRHTHATWCDLADMPLTDRMITMGHARAAMTLNYTHVDVERRRESLLLAAGSLTERVDSKGAVN